MLERGRNNFRSAQVHSIGVDEIHKWELGVPSNKSVRGFGNDVCGRLLCPSNRDWTDPAYVRSLLSLLLVFRGTNQLVCSIRQQIQLFQIPVTHDEFPCFLWEDERADPQDTNKGFLRGQLLVKVPPFLSYLLSHVC